MSQSPKAGLQKPIAIYYEQQHWFRPLFEQLDARGVNWQKVDARNHQYADSSGTEYSLLFNRMSPSAWQRGLATESFTRSTTCLIWKRKAFVW